MAHTHTTERRGSLRCARQAFCLGSLVWVLLAWFGASPLCAEPEATDKPFRLIGATAVVTETSSGLPFKARVDTGATTCSIHCEAMEIENGSNDGHDNVGKPIRFLVVNKQGESKWLDAEIADYIEVRTSKRIDWRYKVKLPLRWKDYETEVLVTLNNREKMTYPVLLGRNFLRGKFLVNVAWKDRETPRATAEVEVDADHPGANTLAANDRDADSSRD